MKEKIVLIAGKWKKHYVAILAWRLLKSTGKINVRIVCTIKQLRRIQFNITKKDEGHILTGYYPNQFLSIH
jgi:23S rRNA-/tRNA-specific pseudouridylate synthase